MVLSFFININIPMQQLIEYLYNKYISSEDQLAKHLCKNQPTPIKLLPNSIFTMLPILLARNILLYQPNTQRVHMHPSQMLFFQRIAKIKKRAHLIWHDKGCELIIEKWIQNVFLPFQLQKNLDKSLSILTNANVIFQDHSVNSLTQYMVNVTELTKNLSSLVQAQMCGMNLANFEKNQKKNELIISKQSQKIDEYIAQLYGQDCLLVLKMTQNQKFINQKQLLAKTLLDVTVLRTCVNILIENGLLTLYIENARSTLYQAITENILRTKYINHVCKSILNLQVYLNKTEQKDKMIKFQAAILQLDDILLLFGY